MDIYKGTHARSFVFARSIPGGDFSEVVRYVSLPDSVETAAGDFEVKPKPEIVDGHPCTVVTRKGLDTLWLDPACHFACRKREQRNEKGELRRSWHHQRFRQVLPRLWLPNEQKTIYYISPETDPNLAGVFQRSETNRLVKVSFEPLSDDFFEVPIPEENGVIVDFVRDMQYEILPHHMTDHEIRNRAIGTARRQMRQLAPWQPGIVSWIILATMAIVALVPFFIQRMR